MKNSIVKTKSYAFAVEIVKLYKYLKGQNEYDIARQLLRSGTSIGANVEEATGGESRKDFIHKMALAAKEAREAHYWLRLLRDSDMLPDSFVHLLQDGDEIIRITAAIVKTSQLNSNRNLRADMDESELAV